MKNITKLIAMLLLGMTSSAALAATGAYVTGDVGQASYGYGSSNPIAVRIGGGYNFLKLLDDQLTIGAEAGLADFGSVNYLTTTVKTTGLMVDGIATYKIPNVQGLSAFAKVGMMHSSTKYTTLGFSTTGTSNGVFVGVGARYDFNDQLGVRVQYEDYGSSAVSAGIYSYSLNTISAGVIYSF